MILKALVLFFIGLNIASASYASVELGVGLSSATSGRYIPALAGAIGGTDWILTGTSTGARNGYYYYSNYSMAWMKTWQAGEFGWGDLKAGLGVGAFYSLRSFKDEGATRAEEDSDFGAGPAFRVQWGFLSPVYCNLEVIWGLRDIYKHLTLNGQDLVTFSVGVAL